jgi:hypothetical protein
LQNEFMTLLPNEKVTKILHAILLEGSVRNSPPAKS